MTRFALDEYLLHCCLMKLAINYYQYVLSYVYPKKDSLLWDIVLCI